MMPGNPFRRRVPFASMMVAVVIACSSPTEVCGCSPMPPNLWVVGTVTDASGAAVNGARVLVDGVLPTTSFDPPLRDATPGTTDAAGEFSTGAFSREGHSGDLALRAGVILAGTTDTLRFRLGTARFRTGSPPDTVRVAIAVP